MSTLLRKRLRLLLFICSVGNILGSLAALISPSFFNSQFFKTQPDMVLTYPYLPMYHYIFWGFVLIMGIGYWMAAIDPSKNRALVLVGALGKLLAVFFWAMMAVQGNGKWLMVSGAAWDGLLGILLLLGFFSGKNENQPA